MLAISRMKPLCKHTTTITSPLSLYTYFHSQTARPERPLSNLFLKPLRTPSRITSSSRNLVPTCCSVNLYPSKVRSLHKDAASGSGSGQIHVIVGPMFAGKTTTLLHRIKSECSNGRRVAVIKSDKDTRYGLDSIVTHDGQKFPCLPLTKLSSFRQKLGPQAYDELEVIGIDEAQFFEDLYEFCSEAADQDGKIVYVSGLDGDYLRRSFGSVLNIIPIADSVTKLTARCELCGERAFFTLRKTDETKTELIAGAEVYMPVCRKHYVSGQIVKEATKTVLESQKVQSVRILNRFSNAQ